MKLAVFTPLNPARCGVSDYSEALLPRLARHGEIEVFVDNYEPIGFPADDRLKIRPSTEYEPPRFRRHHLPHRQQSLPRIRLRARPGTPGDRCPPRV